MKTKKMLSDPDIREKLGTKIVNKEQLQEGTHVLLMDGDNPRVAKVDTINIPGDGDDTGYIGLLLYTMPRYQDESFQLSSKCTEDYGQNYWEFKYEDIVTILDEPFSRKKSAFRTVYTFSQITPYLEKRSYTTK